MSESTPRYRDTAQPLEERVAAALGDEARTKYHIDGGLSRVLATRFRLGMFDPDAEALYASTSMEVIGCDAHRALAYEAALKSIVLLKNHAGILPLGPEVKKLRVVGPTAADLGVLLGSYHGLNERLSTLIEGIVGQVPEGRAIEYRLGTQLIHQSTASQEWLFDPAAQPDVVIACMGLSPILEGEEGDAIASSSEGDRTEIELPPVQQAFLRRLAAAGARIVLVVTGGGPIALGELADLVEAVLFVWYPGQAGGEAVADILFGRASRSVTPTCSTPTRRRSPLEAWSGPCALARLLARSAGRFSTPARPTPRPATGRTRIQYALISTTSLQGPTRSRSTYW